MKNLKSSIIKEIAQELDCGNNCYYNFKTEEIIAIPDFSVMSDEQEFIDCFKDVLKKVKKNRSDLIKIEVLEGFESFKIMEQFTDQLSDSRLKTELENILQNRKPFQNFKHQIDHSDKRQEWFDFKQKELEKIVEAKLSLGKAGFQDEL